MEISRFVRFNVAPTLLAAVALNLLYHFIILPIRSDRAAKKPVWKPFAPQKFLTLRISNIPRGGCDATTKEDLRAFLSDLSIEAEGIGGKPNLLGYSYSPSAVSTFSARYAVATATFEHAPAISELELVLRQKLGAGAGRLKVDRDFLGITPLFDSDRIHVDIIAVTGLAGHAFGSWKSKNMPDMWLRDFLPQSVENVRILTYGYDTKIHGSQSEESILELSKAFLESVKCTRRKDIRNRPLILIAHSLGGLVVKEALAQASEGSEEDQKIYRSCYALLLFGVPNRGLNNLSLQSMVKGQPNESLVRDLGESSRFLSLLHERFNARFTFDDSHILSISETKHTATAEWNPGTGEWERTGPEVMMVGHTSATNAHPNEKTYNRLSINSDHSEMVKFSGISNSDYLNIQDRLVNLVSSAPSVIKARFADHKRKITQLERQFLRNLGAPNSEAFRNGNRTPGTLSWFLQNEPYQNWKSAESSTGLWIQGSPGQGKTILAKFILDDLKGSIPDLDTPSEVIYFFFYDQDESYRTAGAAMRSLIAQLLHLVPEVFPIISETCDIESPSFNDNLLRDILRELLQTSQLSSIYCVIDGLDECQNDESKIMLLNLITNNPRSSSTRKTNSRPVLKTIFTSRPTVEIYNELHHLPNIQLKANHEDLVMFIKNKVHDLRIHEDLKQKAIHLLGSRVEQTFLWISIVLRRLTVETSLLSEAEMEDIINDSPSDLEPLFENIIRQIKEARNVTAQKLLIWAVYGRRPLALDELQEAIAVQEDSTSKDSIKKYSAILTESNVTIATGVILEIIDRKVHLVHQSAKDFLLKSGHLAEFAFCMSLHPSSYLAKICMTYLCFTDIVESNSCRSEKSPNERHTQHRFLQYAARNWYHHLEVKDDMNRLARLIGQLTEPGSPALLTWGEVNGIVNLSEARDTWEVALKVNIPWLVDFQIDSTEITEIMIEKAAANGTTAYSYLRSLVNKHGPVYAEKELCLVVQHFDHALVHQVLSKQSTALITQNVFEAAAANNIYGRLVIEAILEFNTCLTITDRFIHLAQKNNITGKNIIHFVIENHDLDITEKGVQQLVKGGDTESANLLFKREQLNGLQVALGSAVTKGDYDMVMLLLDKGGYETTITESYMEKLAKSFHHVDLKRFLQTHKQHCKITENAFSTIMADSEKRHELLLFLLTERREELQITEKVLEEIIFNEDDELESLKFLLTERSQEIHIKLGAWEGIWKDAAYHSTAGDKIIGLLLTMKSPELDIIEAIMECAGENKSCGYEVMLLFLKNMGQDIHMAEEIVKGVLKSSFTPEQILSLLTDAQNRGIWLDAEKLIPIAARYGKNHYAMAFVFEMKRDEIDITEELLKEVVKNQLYADKIMKWLFEINGNELQITEDILVESVRYMTWRCDLLETFFEKIGDKLQITEEVLKAVVKNKRYGHSIMGCLLWKKGNEIRITEKVLLEAAGELDSYMLTFLLTYHSNKIEMTDTVLKAILRDKDNLDTLARVSKYKGKEVRITAEIREIMSEEQFECWTRPETYFPYLKYI